MSNLTVKPIGCIVCNDGRFLLKLDSAYIPALKELDGFSHIQVLWWFHGCDTPAGRSVLQVSSPYVGSPEIIGTFATRSPERPNPVALSTAQLVSIDHEQGIIEIAYTDAMDGSPIIDIKPYTPSLDRIEHPTVPCWCSSWPKSYEESASFDWSKVFNWEGENRE